MSNQLFKHINAGQGAHKARVGLKSHVESHCTGQALNPSSVVLGGRSGVLVNHPRGSCLLGVPGLEKLLGQLAKLVGIRRAVNDSVESLNLKLLAERQFDRGSHEPI